jgi:endonuclease/exonuclease/phosphatase family metal-dependent hydrolase
MTLSLSALTAAGAGYWRPGSVLWSSGPDQDRGQTLVIASLNMAKEESAEAALKDLNSASKIGQADVLLLQEVYGDDRHSIAAELADRMHRYVAFAPAAPGVNDQGLAILSRYPLHDITTHKLKACNLRFRSRHRIGLAATADSPFGPVRIIDAHLDTRINTADRLAQLEPLLAESKAFSGPRLIGGDMNTNDMYWIGNVAPVPRLGGHSQAIETFMKQHGFATPFGKCGSTFPSLGLHLDWIFSQGVENRSAGVVRIPFSDHHAVWTRLSFDTQPM